MGNQVRPGVEGVLATSYSGVAVRVFSTTQKYNRRPEWCVSPKRVSQAKAGDSVCVVLERCMGGT